MGTTKPRNLITILTVLCLLTAAFGFLADEVAAADEPISTTGRFHINLQDDSSLSPETKGDANETGATQTVYADYDDIFIGRSNPRWVDVGTWSSTSRDSEFVIDATPIVFNMWYSIAGETNGAQCTFRFTLSVDGVQVAYVEGESEDPNANEVVEYTASASAEMTTVPAGANMELYIEYKAFEDCDIYFDSVAYDSGFWLDTDFCKVFSFEAKTKEVSLEIYDSFQVDWEEVANHIILEIDGSKTTDAMLTVEKGKKRNVNGTDLNTETIVWEFSSALVKDQVVTIKIRFNDGEHNGFTFQVEVGGKAVGNPSSGDDGDDDGSDDTMLYAGVGGVLILLCVGGAVLFMKKRKEDGNDDFQLDDEEDEDYEDDEDEMEYED